MRIVLVGPVYPFRGGIAHYTSNLFRAFDSLSTEVLLLSYKRQYPKWLYPGSSDYDPSLSGINIPTAKFMIDSINPLSWLKSFTTVKAFNPDAVILQWWTPYWAIFLFTFGFLVKHVLRKKCLFLCHNVLPHEANGLTRWITRIALYWGDNYLVQSGEEKDRLMVLLHTQSVIVTPHPIYNMFVDTKISVTDARTHLGLPDHVPVILFFGIVRKYKGLSYLLSAFSVVRNSIENAILIIAGEFWEPREKYEAQIRELGIEKAVMIFDEYIPNEDVPYFFISSDLLVAPYTKVTGSGVVQMARGFSLPVVTTLNDNSVEEYSQISVVPPEDIPALVNAILLSLERPRQPKKIDGLCPENKEWVDMAQKIVELLKPQHG